MGLITIKCDGETETHIESFGISATICGLAGGTMHIPDWERPSDQEVLKPTGKKVDCRHCKEIWAECRDVKPRQID